MSSATATSKSDRRISPVFLAIAAVMVAAGWGVWTGFADNAAFAVFLFVVAAWVVSLCLHEYAHARTALHSGDISIGAKGYLTLNPLKYTHALLSIVLPVIFVILGGIGLPGGAVYIERDRVQGRWRHSVISAAGPLTNALFAIVCTAPFWLGGLDGMPLGFREALAFLAFLQISATLLNFVPVPGLDGYGVIEPWLSHKIRRQIAPFAPFGLIAVFVVLYQGTVNHAFFDLIDWILGGLGVDQNSVYCGQNLFQFWSGQDHLCSMPQLFGGF